MWHSFSFSLVEFDGNSFRCVLILTVWQYVGSWWFMTDVHFSSSVLQCSMTGWQWVGEGFLFTCGFPASLLLGWLRVSNTQTHVWALKCFDRLKPAKTLKIQMLIEVNTSQWLRHGLHWFHAPVYVGTLPSESMRCMLVIAFQIMFKSLTLASNRHPSAQNAGTERPGGCTLPIPVQSRWSTRPFWSACAVFSMRWATWIRQHRRFSSRETVDTWHCGENGCNSQFTSRWSFWQATSCVIRCFVWHRNISHLDSFTWYINKWLCRGYSISLQAFFEPSRHRNSATRGPWRIVLLRIRHRPARRLSTSAGVATRSWVVVSLCSVFLCFL